MLQAISGDMEFLQLLRSGAFSGSVHSAFRNAINLQTSADGKLYGIVAARFGNIPDTLLVADNAFEAIHAEIGAEVHVGHDTVLFIGNTGISFADCREWTSQLPAITASKTTCLANADSLDAFLADHGATGGMKAMVDASLISRETTRMLAETSAALMAALMTGDAQAIKMHATGLIGLGPGLTPSGDDFLSGLLAILHGAPQSARCYRDLSAAVVARAAEGTNAISATALKNAALGRVPESVITLVAALNSSEAEQITSAACQVLAIGSSSGTDMLYGISAGLRTIAN